MNVASRRVGGESIPPTHADAAKATKAGWTRFDADKILVVLERTDAAGERWSGMAVAGGELGGAVQISYDLRRGLELSNAGPA